jgi:NADH-quinone oxidoreductase subunit N
MTVGNLVALRQRRMVRLLAWSSVAQAGYILAPLGVLALASGRTPEAVGVALTAVFAYTMFYIILELGAFGSVVALRGSADGGTLDDYRGAAARRPWLSAAFVLALAGLAGLPPALAGLFAKVAVVRALLDGGAGWLAVLVALNAVVGLAYYVRAAVVLFAPSTVPSSVTSAAGAPSRVSGRVARGAARSAGTPPVPVAVGLVLAVVTLAGLVIGFAPQLILDAAAAAGR